MTTQLEKDWTRTACLEGLLEENLLGLVCKVASEQTIRPRSKCFRQTRPKWKCLAIMHSENQTAHQMSRSRWWRNDDLGWFCSHRTFQACSQSYALLYIFYSQNRGHLSEKGPQVRQQTCNKMTKNGGRKSLLQSSSQSPDFNAVVGP